MGKERTCPECGRSLAADVPAECPCPLCALAGALALSGEQGEGMLKPGDRIGNYVLVERLGRGGYGVVFRARQVEPIQREVALKVIKPGMDTVQVIARFEAERQALARMSHPNIARVYDAGCAENGRPYFAMELVPGDPLTLFCDRHCLPLKDRLALFITICEAVQHAHQKGIIHRDLKPSNVLVSMQDGRPVPKIIDFGIAKAVEQPLTEESLATGMLQLLGTPAYMSPEQAEAGASNVDTRSDLYSLGAILYELLTGQTPLDREELLEAGLDQMREMLRLREPHAPSRRLESLPPKAIDSIAPRRQTDPTRLIHIVRGDLDWIALKALEKEPARRYPTATAFAADVLHYLNHEPVEARPPSRLYQFKKLLRRNRGAAGAAGLIVLSLLLSSLFSTGFYLREKRARLQAESRAYASDMGLASRLTTRASGLGGVADLLSSWPGRKPDLRGWEWYYLNGLCHQEQLAMDAHSGALASVAWNPDGTRLASGGRPGGVQIWDALSGTRVAMLTGHDGLVAAVAWHPDGQRLATCGADGTTRVWDVAQSRELHRLRGPGTPFFALAWHPGGGQLAAANRNGAITLWDAASGAELKVLRGRRAAQSLGWSHDGSRLAAVGGGQLLMLWNVATGQALLEDRPLPKSGGYRTVAWSPDDRRLTVGCDDFTIKLFDAATGTNTATFWGHASSITSVTWSPDGTRLASADNADGTVRIWDVPGVRMLRSFRGHRGPVNGLAWHPAGSHIASAGADGTLRLWDADQNNRNLRPIRHPSQVLSLSWHPDGRRLAAAGRHDSAVIWDTLQTGKPIELRSPVAWVWSIAWKPDGSQLATVGDDNMVRLWDPNGHETAQIRITPGGVIALAWRPDGASLAVAGTPCGLNLWNLRATNTTRLLELTNESSFALAWRPDGRLLALAAAARILILDGDTGRLLRVLSGHTEDVRALAWRPDGLQLASAGDDSLVKVWDPEAGRQLRSLVGYASPVRAVAWSPDGARLVTGGWDGAVKVWNPDLGLELCALTEHPAQVAAVAFSPDGARLASSDLDGLIYLRDATPGRQVERRHRGGPANSAPAKTTPPPSAMAEPGSAAMQPLIWYRDTAERFRHMEADLHSQRLLVRFLADCPFAELRDGRRAIELGEEAATLSHHNNASILDDLAAAYAEARDFAKAAAVQQEAIGLVNGPAAKAELATRLRLYESNIPTRDYDW